MTGRKPRRSSTSSFRFWTPGSARTIRLCYRSLFLRGLIHAQRQQHALARPFFEEALEGQRATLGRMHAHTLRTEYELAVAMKLTEDPGWVPLMREVRDLASYARACS